MSETIDTTTDRGLAPRYSRQQKLDWIDGMYRPHFDACKTVHEYRELAHDYANALRSIGITSADLTHLHSGINLRQFTYFRACPDSTRNTEGMTVNWCGVLVLFLWTFSMEPPGPVGHYWYNGVYYAAIIAAISACWRALSDFASIRSARSSGVKSKVYVDAIVSRHLTLMPLVIVAFVLEIAVGLICLSNGFYVQFALFVITAVFSGLNDHARRDHHRRIGL